MTNETIKAKATYLRQSLELGDRHSRHSRPLGKNAVKLSHCHELIAAALGFNSKVAMNAYYSDPVYWDDDEFYFERYRFHAFRGFDLKFIMERVAHLRDTPLHYANSYFIAEALAEALAPPCQDCGAKDADGRFVHDGDSSDPVMFVCRSCSQDEDEYDTCTFCGPDILYKASDINRSGECPEHSGESYMDEEEREGWDSLIEYWNK